MSVIPDDYRDLLERPLYAHLATIRPDGKPQVNPMWFAWDGEHLRFTNTTVRQKYKNVTANPEVAISVNDPDQPYRYLEVRGSRGRSVPRRVRRRADGGQQAVGAACHEGSLQDGIRPEGTLHDVSQPADVILPALPPTGREPRFAR